MLVIDSLIAKSLVGHVVLLQLLQYAMKDNGDPAMLGRRSREECGLEAFEAALSIRRDVLLPPHPDLARTHGYLGVRLERSGEIAVGAQDS